jgi:hypothetical protein
MPGPLNAIAGTGLPAEKLWCAVFLDLDGSLKEKMTQRRTSKKRQPMISRTI